MESVKIGFSIFLVIIILLIIAYLSYRKLEAKRSALRDKELFYINYKRPAVKDELKNKTLEEYIHYEKYGKSKLASFFYAFSDEEATAPDKIAINNFEFEVMYYWDCKENLNEYQQEIIDLWKKFFDLFSSYKRLDEIKSILSILTRLSTISGIAKEKKGELDSQLIDLFEGRFRSKFKTIEFRVVVEEIVDWYTYKGDYYYPFMGIGTTETELHHLETLYNNYDSDFEKLKTEVPALFLKYSGCIYYFYENLPRYTDRNYDAFFRYVMLGRIAVFRNIGELDKMSDTIYLFMKYKANQIRGANLYWHKVMDYYTGFGEKPFRLLKLYLTVQVIFFILMYPYSWSPIELKGILPDDPIWSKMVSTLYFNSTTLLTSVYGDISPNNAWAKLLVIIEQVLGYITCGSLVALTLRKWFRY
ncbi:potassium channel family protein [Cohnella sp. AR92]|uniref:potassium channel family protein n=1 Tax=Cohnella sp. AR92 TaxID=648716 RepID=UPI000F8F74AD|nr:potassium channel family protein [Cohnella sp. AR92]RUS44591.1 two pore domain potassium channel family protein [Cohnella sp. AR92]